MKVGLGSNTLGLWAALLGLESTVNWDWVHHHTTCLVRISTVAVGMDLSPGTAVLRFTGPVIFLEWEAADSYLQP